ncbi:hypothetical protein Mapa_002692 [Marchantia paleacea]|nr:hypothetical protein Mapa_002692 [Marchantia paleacea]
MSLHRTVKLYFQPVSGTSSIYISEILNIRFDDFPSSRENHRECRSHICFQRCSAVGPWKASLQVERRRFLFTR